METNIVEVENLFSSQKKTGQRIPWEVKRYLEQYPNTRMSMCCWTDLNGCFRGKRIPVSSLSKLEKGCTSRPPFCHDILGNVVEEAGLGQDMGEPDCTCVPVPGT
ncbi:Gamma-glutamyl-putrescine synthetase [Raoultella ornithinolytica]|nr:Gamma-glutamyl-putrescine synthetase [Raoultella ornithinolytica]